VTTLGARLFSDDTRNLDRFGLLLVLCIASVTINSLVDLNASDRSAANAMARIVVSVVLGVTMMVAVGAAGVARRPRIIADVIASASIVIAVGMAFLQLFSDASPASGFAQTRGLAWVIIAALTPLFVVRRVAIHDRVTTQTLLGALAAFLLIALAFDYAFLSYSTFVGFDFFGTPQPTTAFMYFSLVTITTLGYGDLTAAQEFGRYLAVSEAVIGQIFLVTFVARLVSLYGRTQPRTAQAASPKGDRRDVDDT
jgi:Ion channel